MKREIPRWWKAFFMTLVTTAGFAAYISLNWNKLENLAAGPELPDEYSESDLLPCQPGTHQENGKCVSNPTRPAAPAPASAGAGQPKAAPK